jgi:hypothetical protein
MAGTASGGMAGADDGPVTHGAGCVDAVWSTYLRLTDGTLLELVYKIDTVVDDATDQPLTGVVSVQDGLGSGCAALADGTVKCWLLDLSKSPGAGQLGNGSTAPPAETDEPFRATPVVVEGGAPLSNIRAMADGVASPASCAITNDGQLYCWGDLTWLVGGGTTLETGTPRLVTIDGTSPLTGVIRVALGGRQACALRHGASGNEV